MKKSCMQCDTLLEQHEQHKAIYQCPNCSRKFVFGIENYSKHLVEQFNAGERKHRAIV